MGLLKVKLISLNMIFICLLSFVTTATGEIELEQKLVLELKEARNEILQSDLRQREILAELHTLNEQIRAVGLRRGRLNEKNFRAKNDIREVAREVVELEERISEQARYLRQRLKAMYMLGEMGPIPLLFSATSSHELDQNLRFFKLIAERDHRLIQSYRQNLSRLQHQHESLARRVESLVKLERQVAQQEELLDSQQRQRATILQELRDSTQIQLQRVQDLRISGELKDLLRPTFFEQKGHLRPPIQGRVKRGFGLIADPDYKFRLLHKGLFFQAPLGSEVRAIFSGHVAFSGHLPGYGQTVILDHGDNYYSVYGYLREVQVSQGDELDAGHLISLVDQGPLEKLSGLYFEIRHFSDSIDPKYWLITRRTP